MSGEIYVVFISIGIHFNMLKVNKQDVDLCLKMKEWVVIAN